MQNLRSFIKMFCSLFVLFFLVAVFASQAYPQNNSTRPMIWEELKRVQAEERTQLETMQKETLREVLEVQKEQLTAMRNESTANANDLLLPSTKFKDERVEIAKVHSEERSRLSATQSQGRQAFQQIASSVKTSVP
jgi:hypothetical protein